MAKPVDVIRGQIVDYDEKRGELVIRAKYGDIAAMDRRQYKSVTIRLDDSRPLSPDQRRSCYALIREIADWQGDDAESAKEFLKLDFLRSEAVEMMDDFSLSNAPMSMVAAFQRWLARFILRHDIPARQSLLSFVDDVEDYTYACLIHKKCAICGKSADLHHVDAVGMGRNRNEISHLGARVLPLCREHHQEFHTIGRDTFLQKWHLPPGIEADRTILKIYRLKEKTK